MQTVIKNVLDCFITLFRFLLLYIFIDNAYVFQNIKTKLKSSNSIETDIKIHLFDLYALFHEV